MKYAMTFAAMFAALFGTQAFAEETTVEFVSTEDVAVEETEEVASVEKTEEAEEVELPILE